MAIDPKKLKSYMAEREDEADFEDADEEMEGEEGEAEEGEEGEAEEVEEQSSMEALGGAMFTYSEEIEQAAADISEGLTHDDQPSADTVEMLKEQYGQMPAPLKDAIKEHGKGMEYEHVLEIAEELEAADHIGDPEQFAGWVYWAAKNV
jgi:hypothetical protein